MTAAEYRDYLNILKEMKVAMTALPGFESFRTEGQGFEIPQSLTDAGEKGADERELLSRAASLYKKLDSVIKEGEQNLLEHPEDNAQNRPALTEDYKELEQGEVPGILTLFHEAATKVMANQNRDEYERCTKDPAYEFAGKLAAAAMSIRTIYDKKTVSHTLNDIESNIAALDVEQKKHKELKNSIQKYVLESPSTKVILKELDPEKSLEKSLESYQASSKAAGEKFMAKVNEKKGLEQEKLILGDEIIAVEKELVATAGVIQDDEAKLIDLNKDLAGYKEQMLLLEADYKRNLEAVAVKNNELDQRIQAAKADLANAQADYAVVDDITSQKVTIEDLNKEQEKILDTEVAPGYTYRQYREDNAVYGSADFRIDCMKKMTETVEHLEKTDSSAKNLYNVANETLRQFYRGKEGSGHLDDLMAVQDFLTKASTSSKIKNTTDLKIALNKQIEKDQEIMDKASALVNKKMKKGAKGDAEAAMRFDFKNTLKEQYNDLERRKAAIYTPAQRKVELDRAQKKIDDCQATLDGLRNARETNTADIIKNQFNTNKAAIDSAINECNHKITETAKHKDEMATARYEIAKKRAELDKKRDLIIFGKIDEEIEAAKKNADNAKAKEIACGNLLKNVNKIASSRQKLNDYEKQIADKNLTADSLHADHKASIREDERVLRTKLTSYTKAGWKESDNSRAFTAMRDRLNDVRDAVAEGSNANAKEVRDKLHALAQAAQAYKDAKAKQHRGIFASKQRKNRLQAADDILTWAGNLEHAYDALEPKQERVKNILDIQTKCKNDRHLTDTKDVLKAAALKSLKKHVLEQPAPQKQDAADREQIKQPAVDAPVIKA